MNAKALRAYLEILRLPLTPTAVADSYAGYCLAVAWRGIEPSGWGLLKIAGASTCLYWMGMVMNDLFDFERDLQRHPGRPLPRGAASPFGAALLGASLIIAGIAAGLSVSILTAMAALALVLLVFSYNAGGKRVPILGSLLMGSCRAMNLLLGVTAALAPIPLPALPGVGIDPEILAAAGILGVYIAGVTSVSLLEDRPYFPVSFLAATIPLLLVPAILAGFAWDRSLALWNAAVLAGLLCTAIWRGMAGAPSPRKEPAGPPEAASPNKAPAPPSPGIIPGTCGALKVLHPAESFVRSGLMGIFLVDAGFLIARGLPRQAAAEYGLLILAWLWRRLWLQSSA